ncbi:hypothetical protein J6590_000745 [Homalodisca vitripennis]|nr:hypothetical protein J6590_000745 [Homalodisca vitripennis]
MKMIKKHGYLVTICGLALQLIPTADFVQLNYGDRSTSRAYIVYLCPTLCISCLLCGNVDFRRKLRNNVMGTFERY